MLTPVVKMVAQQTCLHFYTIGGDRFVTPSYAQAVPGGKIISWFTLLRGKDPFGLSSALPSRRRVDEGAPVETHCALFVPAADRRRRRAPLLLLSGGEIKSAIHPLPGESGRLKQAFRHPRLRVRPEECFRG